MKTRLLNIPALLGFVLLGFNFGAHGQMRPRLEVPAFNLSNKVTLVLHGEPGTNYAIEVSRNLNAWLPLTSGVVSNGQFNFQLSTGKNSPTLYFRARVNTPLPPVMLSVQTDTNAQTVTLITPEDGGTVSLMDTRGITYTLAVPPQAVTESHVVRMTVVTNLGGLLFAAGRLGAVLFETNDFQFSVPAQFFIQFPTNHPTDPNHIATYAYDADGSYFRLVPTIVISNGLMAPILNLSGFGCSVATVDEILQQGQRLVGDTNSPGFDLALAKTIAKGAFYNSCYPAEKTRATFVAKGLENANRAASQEAAAKLAANAQLAPGDQISADQLLSDAFNNFYTENLAQYLTEMQQNCPLAEVVITYLLGHERQAQLLGVANELPSGFENLCNLFSTCAHKIDDCCKSKGASEQAVVELIALARQYELLGCDTADPLQYIQDCLPVWYGTVKYEDTHTYSTGSGNFESDYQYKLSAALFPTNLMSSSPGPGYLGLTGYIKGPANGTYRRHSRTTGSCCYCFADDLRTSALAADVNIFFQLVWSTTNNPPGPPQNGLLMFPDSDSAAALASVDSLLTHTDSHGDADCNQVLQISTSHGNDSYPLQTVFYNSPSITGTTNAVVGTYSTNWTADDGSHWTQQISWDLHRK